MREQHDILYPDMISGPTATWRGRLLSILKSIPFWIPATAAFVIIGAIIVMRNVKQINGVSESSMQTRQLLPGEEYLLEGIYYVRSFGGDSEILSSAEVSGIGEEYTITIFSDYSPVEFQSEILADGALLCDGLGYGSITYKPSTGTIRIVFTSKGQEICELVK